MAKYTRESYIEIAEKIYGNKYDYSLTNYINSYHKIKVKNNETNEVIEIDPIKFIRKDLSEDLSIR